MLHYVVLGHFDMPAFQRGVIKVTKELDDETLKPILAEFGEVDASGTTRIGGSPLYMREGYLRCPWLTPKKNVKAAEFARKVQEATGCVVGEIKSGTILDLTKIHDVPLFPSLTPML